MTPLTNKKTKTAQLVEAYRELALEFRTLGNVRLIELADMWDRALEQLLSVLSQKNPPVKRSAVVGGLEQGLRETPSFFATLPEPQKRAALHAYRRVVEANVPGFFKRDQDVLQKVLLRGRIKTENEWYLLRHRVDEIEGEPPHASEVQRLYALLGDYETSA